MVIFIMRYVIFDSDVFFIDDVIEGGLVRFGVVFCV